MSKIEGVGPNPIFQLIGQRANANRLLKIDHRGDASPISKAQRIFPFLSRLLESVVANLRISVADLVRLASNCIVSTHLDSLMTRFMIIWTGISMLARNPHINSYFKPLTSFAPIRMRGAETAIQAPASGEMCFDCCGWQSGGNAHVISIWSILNIPKSKNCACSIE
jgi:hypothetical protein